MVTSMWYLRQHAATLHAFFRLLTTRADACRHEDARSIPLRSEPLQRVAPPLPDALIDDFVRFSGGDPAWYEGQVPPLLYPQWGLALAARNFVRLPYAVRNIVNAGTTVVVNAPLPRHEPLVVSARWLGIHEDERLITFEQEVVTQTASRPRALVATFVAALRKPGASRGRSSDEGGSGSELGSSSAPDSAPDSASDSASDSAPDSAPKAQAPRQAGSGAGPDDATEPHDATQASARRPRNMIPQDAQAWDTHAFSAHAGGDFALLTGDVNPVHWLPPYARMLGFARPILHGFATAAFAFESVVRRLGGGDPQAVQRFEVRFTRPLVLPAEVSTFFRAASPDFASGVLVGGGERGGERGGEIYVGKHVGGPAVAVGTVAMRTVARVHP